MSKLHLVIGGCVVIAAGAFLVAGPLNPPTGPVSAGGKTTQEIYDAVTNISGSIGAVGGRGPAVPGGNRAAGTFALSTNGASFSGGLVGMRMASHTPTSNFNIAGSPVMDSCTFVVELGDGAAKAFRVQMGGLPITSVVAVVPSVGGNTTYTVGTPRLVGVRQYNVQRSDGSMAALQELDFIFVTMTVLEAGGATYTINQ